jgi:hypothetical protein
MCDPVTSVRQRDPRFTLYIKFPRLTHRAGTWTKSSKVVGPRRPFGKDVDVLNYDHDSEAEWEDDPDEGEDLSGEDEQQSDEALSEDEDDGFFCGDDEIEMMDGWEAELDHPELKDEAENQQSLRALAKKNTALHDVAKKRKLQGLLVPVQIGPVWEEELGSTNNNVLEAFRIEFLNGKGGILATKEDVTYRCLLNCVISCRRKGLSRPVYLCGKAGRATASPEADFCCRPFKYSIENVHQHGCECRKEAPDARQVFVSFRVGPSVCRNCQGITEDDESWFGYGAQRTLPGTCRL